MRHTITELNKTIEIMRKAYPFKDEDTQIGIESDLCSHVEKLSLLTIDKDTNTEVSLQRTIETEGDKEKWYY